ncbi:DUF5330 domain-containing protein [Ciceribacter sp. L1K22]|nr:DUF5330 domain-containing protein [Ciceribacter sp. L1K22]MBO3759377.1 DUF5330 domain-containing protein [Ciceribacter sp. L1K22]
MWFLIKGTFWFTMMLVALSFFSGREATEEATGSRFEMTDAVAAASEAYQYLSKICLEKPEVCEKGAETLTALGHRAREGALVAFELLDKQLADEGQPAAAIKAATPEEAIVTGTVATQSPGVPLPRAKPAAP